MLLSIGSKDLYICVLVLRDHPVIIAMTRTILDKLINGTELPPPKLLLIADSVSVRGNGLLLATVSSHLNSGKKVHYVTTSVHPSKIYTVENLGEKSNFEVYNGCSDPCGWDKETNTVHLNKPLYELFNFTSSNQENAIVIDRIDDFVNHQSELQLINSLHKLSTDSNVHQVIIHCSTDVISESFLSALSYISEARIIMMPTVPASCKVVFRKKSGKLIKAHEQFRLSESFILQNVSVMEKTSSVQEETSDTDAILAAQTTFNLTLTEDQKLAKNKLLLPHQRIQSHGGHIHYTPDDVDD